jgi:hypothetical protein
MLIKSYNYHDDDDDDDSDRAKYDNDYFEDMKAEYEKNGLDITKIEYFPTTLNIYFLINGDLNISEKIAFQYNMLTKDMRLSSKTFYLLKNTRFNNYAIENAGYNANDEEIFTKDYKFESIMKYVNEKNKNINIKPTEKEIKEIEDNINENVAFILNRFFSYKREIKIKNKEYLIAKYKILHVRGIVHIIGDKFFDIRYKDEKKTFDLKTSRDLLKEKNYEKTNLSKKNNEMNSINITIDLTVLDKSKNPSSLDFINTRCLDKRRNIKDTYDKLLFSLFGVNLKKDDEEERTKRNYKLFYYNLKKNKETQKKKEEMKKENERKDKFYKNFKNLIGDSDDEKKKEKKEGGKKIRKTKKLTKRNQKNTRKKRII